MNRVPGVGRIYPILGVLLAVAVLPRVAVAQWDGGAFPSLRALEPSGAAAVVDGALVAVGPMVVAANVYEVEPNSSLLESNSVSVGDVIDGVIGAPGDFDYYGFDLAAGDVIDVDVDALPLGSALNSIIVFYRVDTIPGATQPIDTLIVAGNIDAFFTDSRIVWSVAKTGRYFVGLSDFDPVTQLTGTDGGPGFTYKLQLLAAASDEVEPNGAAGFAQGIVLGDTTFGFVNPPNDLDYYSLNIPAGTLFEVDADAQEVGSPLFASLRIFGSDGLTLVNLASGLPDVKVRTYVPLGGQHFVSVTDRQAGFGGPAFFYTLNFRSLPLGPGDPTTLYASAVGRPGGAAAGPAGELYIADLLDNRLVRVAANGTLTPVADIGGIADVVVDGFGDLLVTGFEFQARVWRIAPDGTTDIFSSVPEFPGAITVGPDGDVWASDPGADVIWRFDPEGNPRDTILTPNLSLPITDMSFSPDGVLYAINGTNRLFRLVGDALQAASIADTMAVSMAFDEDGYLYIGNVFERRISLYDPTFQLAQADFARTNLGGPHAIVFGRSSSGAMTSRLFIANSLFAILEPFAGGVVETNPTGMRAAGFRVGVDLLVVSPEPLATGTVGEEYYDTLTVESFAGPVTWTLESGALPAGLTLDAASGEISGVPEETGSFPIAVRASGGGRFGTADFTVEVGSPTIQQDDLVDELLGLSGLLTETEKNYLDIIGNRNGILDIGDLRAFLRAGGTPSPTKPTPGSLP